MERRVIQDSTRTMATRRFRSQEPCRILSRLSRARMAASTGRVTSSSSGRFRGTDPVSTSNAVSHGHQAAPFRWVGRRS